MSPQRTGFADLTCKESRSRPPPKGDPPSSSFPRRKRTSTQAGSRRHRPRARAHMVGPNAHRYRSFRLKERRCNIWPKIAPASLTRLQIIDLRILRGLNNSSPAAGKADLPLLPAMRGHLRLTHRCAAAAHSHTKRHFTIAPDHVTG